MDLVPFYKSAKEARVGVMRRYRVEAESKTVVGVVQVAKLLTDSERERFAKVTDLLTHGQSPYNVARLKEAGKNLGGVDLEPKITVASREKDYTALEAKWAERGQVGFTVVKQVDLFSKSERDQLKDPEKVQCSFCEQFTPRITSTVGKGKPRRSSTIEITTDELGRVTWEEKVFYRPVKVVSCPKCVGGVEKVSFPETEG